MEVKLLWCLNRVEFGGKACVTEWLGKRLGIGVTLFASTRVRFSPEANFSITT